MDDREHTVDQWKELIYKEVMEYEAAHSTPTYAPNIRQVELQTHLNLSLDVLKIFLCSNNFNRLLIRMKLMAVQSGIAILEQQPNGRSNVCCVHNPISPFLFNFYTHNPPLPLAYSMISSQLPCHPKKKKKHRHCKK